MHEPEPCTRTHVCPSMYHLCTLCHDVVSKSVDRCIVGFCGRRWWHDKDRISGSWIDRHATHVTISIIVPTLWYMHDAFARGVGGA